MKTRTMSLAFAGMAALGAAGYGLYTAGMHSGMEQARRAAPAAYGASAQAAADGRKVLYWHDPMVPGQKFDQPGKSPYMDMELVPVYAEDGDDQGTVRINPGLRQNLGIRTADVVTGILAPTVEAVGTVAYNERDVTVVQARSGGFVEKLHVRAPLDPVKKGQPLVDLYVPEWVTAQEEFFSAKRIAESGLDSVADTLLEGARQRMRLVGMTDAQIRQVEQTRELQPRFTLVAPSGGVVAELGAREGMTVAPGATLFRINGLATVWINAEVPETAAGLLMPGARVEARTPAIPDTTFTGRIDAILPEVNEATRTIKVRSQLPNPARRLLPGMFATINLSPVKRQESLLVPSEAVIRTGTRSVVMVDQGKGAFKPVEVETGLDSGGQTEIRNGLAKGQKVVVSGQFLIDSEASLRGISSRMDDTAPATTGQGARHRGEGKVERIGSDEVTLSHGPIPSLEWGPMTMGFKLPPGGLPSTIAVGDTVAFEIHQTPEGAFEITSIERLVAGKTKDIRQ